MTIAAFYFSVVVGVVLSSPAPLLQRNTRNVQEVAVDVCSSNENWLGVDAGQHGVESDLLTRPRSTCKDWYDNGYTDSGVFLIDTTGNGVCEVVVFCDMCLRQTGDGWIVIQRRVNDSEAFQDKTWVDYKEGFGDYLGNYWMGLEKIHEITTSSNYDLYVAFNRRNNFLNTEYYAVFTNFRVGSEAQKYKMIYDNFDAARSSSDNMATGFAQHNTSKFSTPDSDNDRFTNHDCANYENYPHGGWWFGVNNGGSNSPTTPICYESNLNGKYYNSDIDNNGDGIKWEGLSLSSTHSLTDTIMAIRRVTN